MDPFSNDPIGEEGATRTQDFLGKRPQVGDASDASMWTGIEAYSGLLRPYSDSPATGPPQPVDGRASAFRNLDFRPPPRAPSGGGSTSLQPQGGFGGAAGVGSGGWVVGGAGLLGGSVFASGGHAFPQGPAYGPSPFDAAPPYGQGTGYHAGSAFGGPDGSASTRRRRSRGRSGSHHAVADNFGSPDGHGDWKKFKDGPPIYEPLLDQMFADVVVDGSSAFHPAMRMPIDVETSDAETPDDEDDDVTPISSGTKRTSSHSTAASTRKKSKSRVVRSVETSMTRSNDIAMKKLQLFEEILEGKNRRKDKYMAREEFRNELNVAAGHRINEIIGRAVGNDVTLEYLWDAVPILSHDHALLQSIEVLPPRGQFRNLHNLAMSVARGPAAQVLPGGPRPQESSEGETSEDTDSDDSYDELFMLAVALLDDDDDSTTTGMYAYALHAEKHLSRSKYRQPALTLVMNGYKTS